jgi:hypothetical protein
LFMAAAARFLQWIATGSALWDRYRCAAAPIRPLAQPRSGRGVAELCTGPIVFQGLGPLDALPWSSHICASAMES